MKNHSKADLKFLFLIICALFATPIVMAEEKTNIPEISANSERLRADVLALTSIRPYRTYNNLESLNAASDYITRQFDGLRCEVAVQAFNVGVNEYKNIICSFGPPDAERIVIGAHYDVCGEQPGADDNASGVAGVLETARLISELKPELKHRIDLVAYTLEEPPFFRTERMGSFVHAKSLKDAGAKVKVMMSLEMIGYFSEEPKSQSYPIFFLKWFYPDKGNFIATVSRMGQGGLVKRIKRLMKEGSKMDVQTLSAPSFVQGLDFSDHMNYWKHGFNAVMITDTAFFRNPNYHEKTDTIDTLNFGKMAEVVKGLSRVAVGLGN